MPVQVPINHIGITIGILGDTYGNPLVKAYYGMLIKFHMKGTFLDVCVTTVPVSIANACTWPKTTGQQTEE